MTDLSIKPYVHLENKHFPNEVRIKINKSDFEKVDFIDNEIPLVISSEYNIAYALLELRKILTRLLLRSRSCMLFHSLMHSLFYLCHRTL